MTLSNHYTEWSTLFLKYPEPWIDSHHWDKFDFYAKAYWPEIIHAEEARFLPVVWDKINMIVWEWAYTPAMVDYYNHMYPNTFSGQNIKTYLGSDYYNLIERDVKKRTLIVLHPYTLIDSCKYNLHPDLIFGLNDKTNMSRLTSNIPNHRILPLYEIKELNSFPFVLKAHSWASWDWVRIIYDNNDLLKALEYFKEEHELMVEDFINVKYNYNVQISILHNWKIEILWVSFQNTTKEWEYDGNNIYKNTILPINVEKIVSEVCSNAFKEWYYWICWLDIIIDYNWDAFLIDPNFRLNGSTSTLILKERIFEETWAWVLKFCWFDSNHPDIKTMIDENLWLWKDSLYLLSSFSNRIKWIIHWHCITYWKDEDDLQMRIKKLKWNWFKI